MKCILSGGGTGGHLYPALAIAEKILSEEPDSEILFVGSKDSIEADVVPKMGYKFVSIPTERLNIGEGPLQKMAINAKVGMSNLAGVAKATAIVRKFKPDAVVGTGGFVCFPTLFAAQMAKYPTYVHEQNAVPGRANKALAKGAKKIFVGFKGAEDSFGYPEKTMFTGNPVRKEFFNLNKAASREKLGIPMDDMVVFAFGGSLGARNINNIALRYMKHISGKSGRTLLMGTGGRHYDECIDRCKAEGVEITKNIKIESYIENMTDYLAASDLMICRAGALSLAEIITAGKPSIIIPIPNTVGNHQYYNAKAIADAGGAFLVEEKDLDIDDICEKIEYLASNKAVLKNMGEICQGMASQDAADIIYREIKKSK